MTNSKARKSNFTPAENSRFQVGRDIADMAGSREVERSSLSTSIQGGMSAASTSHSWQRETIPVLTESQASGLGPVPGTKEIRALLLNFGDDALILRWPFDNRPTIANPVELADWTLPTIEKQEQAQERAELEAMLFLEGEEREEAEYRLAYARELAANRKEGLTPPDFDPAAADSWLKDQIEAVEETATYVIDAPTAMPTAGVTKEAECDGNPKLEGILENIGHAHDATLATDGMSALLKLAEVADALRQRPGPTREQAPPPRRTR